MGKMEAPLKEKRLVNVMPRGAVKALHDGVARRKRVKGMDVKGLATCAKRQGYRNLP
jgi:hypothetical protein